MKTKLTRQDIEAIGILVKDRYKYSAIADALNITPQAVAYFSKKCEFAPDHNIPEQYKRK